MSTLINAVGYKARVKRNEVFIFALFYLAEIDSFQHPYPLSTFKIVFLHHAVFQKNPFHLYRSECSISYQFQIIFIIKEQCIITLLGKQIIMFPVLLLYFRRCIDIVKRQRELGPLPLQGVIRSITIDKIIK